VQNKIIGEQFITYNNHTKVAHSSARPGPAAACNPGLLCASSKTCRQQMKAS